MFAVFLLQLRLLTAFTASALENVALTGTASQSSTCTLGEALHAIDGNGNPEFLAVFCTHTKPGPSHWWSLLPPAVYRITSISITIRKALGLRLSNTKILIGNSLENNGNNNPSCAVISYIPDGATRSFECGGMIGRLVNLNLNGTNPKAMLTVCGLEVYGELAAPSPSFSAVVMGRNIAVVEKKLCCSDTLFHCRDSYWDLLSIRSEEEQREVEELLKTASFPLTKHVWLGLCRTRWHLLIPRSLDVSAGNGGDLRCAAAAALTGTASVQRATQAAAAAPPAGAAAAAANNNNNNKTFAQTSLSVSPPGGDTSTPHTDVVPEF